MVRVPCRAASAQHRNGKRNDGDDGDDFFFEIHGFWDRLFFYEIKRLDKEIKTNPLLVSQLAIILKNEGSIPYDDMEMTEKLAEIVFGVEDRAKVLEDVKGAEITNLRALVEAFAALQYEYPEENDFDVMREALESCNEHADSAHVLEYFKKRAIYVDGRYLHKSLGEFFAAYGFARRACGLGGKVKDKELLDLVIRHCGDDSWGSVVNWFVRKTKLKTLVIPEGVKRIGWREFCRCRDLTKVTLPSSVTYIGDYAFSWCGGLTGITIPDSVTYIGDTAFYECYGMTDIAIGRNVINIGDSSFAGCRSLTSVMIPDSVTSIGDRAFTGCDSLTNATIGSGVTRIGKWAFFYAGLTSIEIPSNVARIDEWAFSSCKSLTKITLAHGVEDIGRFAFCECKSLVDITIPGSVKSIGEEAFEACDELISVTICDGVESIGHEAFYACHSLKNISIPNSVTSIGKGVVCNYRTHTIITYNGTMSQWRTIEKESRERQGVIAYDAWDICTPRYKIYCTDGVLGKDDD